MIWRHGARLEAVEAEAALRARNADALAGRTRQLEGDLRQTTDGLKAMRGKCEEAVNQSRHDRRLLESLLNRLPQGVCVFDAQARLLAWNRHVAGLLDVSDGTLTKGAEAAAILQQVGAAKPLNAADAPVEDWTSFLSETASATGEARLELHMRSGLMLAALRAPGPNGSSMLILSVVGGGKQPLVELRRKTHYDELTGLVARPRFEAVLSKAMSGRRSTDTGLALVLVDIDEMHVVNDAYGHDVGDEVLAIIADILRRHIREADMAARLDGDRFALLLSAIDDVRMVMGRTEELLQAIWQPLEVQGNKLQLSANMGIAMYPNQAIDPDTLMRLAAEALGKAKANKRRNVFIADTVPHTVGTRPSTATKH
jgi:diguanylate cyclase (GGDEF)-like protein